MNRLLYSGRENVGGQQNFPKEGKKRPHWDLRDELAQQGTVEASAPSRGKDLGKWEQSKSSPWRNEGTPDGWVQSAQVETGETRGSRVRPLGDESCQVGPWKPHQAFDLYLKVNCGEGARGCQMVGWQYHMYILERLLWGCGWKDWDEEGTTRCKGTNWRLLTPRRTDDRRMMGDLDAHLGGEAPHFLWFPGHTLCFSPSLTYRISSSSSAASGHRDPVQLYWSSHSLSITIALGASDMGGFLRHRVQTRVPCAQVWDATAQNSSILAF